MQEMGLEPTHSHLRQILSLMRLPFRHAGFLMQQGYSITGTAVWQVVYEKNP